MQNYVIRNALASDLPRIEEIYAYARQFMAEHGNPTQWGNTEPKVSQLQQDIREGKLYVVESDIIHGVFFFTLGNDPTYASLYQGSWMSDAPYGTIHRIAGDSSGGIVKTAVEFGKTKCRHLRIDTHENNRVMQHVVEKLGFSRRGIIYVADGSPRIAYEMENLD